MILFQATRRDTGIIKVVNKINDSEMPSTPKIKFQFSHNLNSTKHWNQSPSNELSNKATNCNDKKNTTALTNSENQRTKSRFQVPIDKISAPANGTLINVGKILDAANILKYDSGKN